MKNKGYFKNLLFIYKKHRKINVVNIFYHGFVIDF